MTVPTSLIISAFSPVKDVRLTLTPQLKYTRTASTTRASIVARETKSGFGESVLLLIDLGRDKNRLGGSILAQVVSQIGAETPAIDDASLLKNFWSAIQQLGSKKKILAYHDRSDGGLLATAVEMAFAGHIGVDLDLPPGHDPFAALFSEELG